MTWLTRVHLRTWQHHMTTIMQPCQCDLQPQIQERHRTTRTQEQHGTTTRCRTQQRNRLTSKRSKLHPPRTGGTFHCRLRPTLHGKMQGFVLRLPPQNKAHATFMRPLQDRSFYTRQFLDREALHREPLPEDLGDVAKWQFLHQLLRIEFHVVRKGSI